MTDKTVNTETAPEARTGRKFVDKTGVITITGEPEKKMSEKEAAYLELVHSRKTKTPLTMKVTGIEPFDGGRAAAGFYKGWKILISPEEFFTEEAFDAIRKTTIAAASERGKAPAKAFYNLLGLYNGAEVDFIPEDILREEHTALASRREAMSLVKNDMWQAVNIKRKGSGEEEEEECRWLIDEGSLVEARVISVAESYATLEIFGIETRVFLPELSYVRTHTAKALFVTGDVVNAVITKAQRDEAGLIRSISASVKLATENPQDKTYALVSCGGKYRGTVSWISARKDKDPVVYVVLDDFGGGSVFTPLPDNILPAIGDKVDITVLRKYEDSHHIFARITHIYRRAF